MASKTKQKAPVPPPEVDDGFDTMMDALDCFFHVSTCPGHTSVERKEAFHAAHDSFRTFIGDDPAMDAAANAPTTMTVN